ncbi:MAG: Hsp33 family molecular chaperone HslO [Succinivibrionaceae bacterium]
MNNLFNDQTVSSTFDSIQRFIFNEMDLRGEIVQLHKSYKSLLENHNYPLCIQKLLGDMQTTISLITAITKFEGEIMLQIRGGNTKLNYILVNSNDKQETRGLASYESDIDEEISFKELVGPSSIMTITIFPKYGKQYQGIIYLEKDSFKECIEEYFYQSMQIDTKIWLYTSAEKFMTAGILIQTLPTKDSTKQKNDLEHISILTNSLTEAEIFTYSSENILYRLYNQESVNVFPNKPIVFKCTCSHDYFKTKLSYLNPNELSQLLMKDGKITCECHCCKKSYTFDEDDILEIIKESKKH